VGLLRARLPELDLESVPDPRAREGRWSLAQILRAVDVLDKQTTVTRSLTLLSVEPHRSYGAGKGPDESVWRHARSFLRAESVKLRGGEMVENEALRLESRP
jgi:hypothetical protein